MVDIFDSKEVTIQRIDDFLCPSDGQALGNVILELDSDCWVSTLDIYFDHTNYISSKSEESDIEGEEISQKRAARERRKNFIQEAWEVFRVGVRNGNLDPFHRLLNSNDNWLSAPAAVKDENGKTPEMVGHYGIGSSRWYWCSYGPEDNRKKSLNKKRMQTYHKKRGCTCHFIVKVLYGRPDVAILILKQLLHVDKNGEACHGVDDTTNEIHSQFAPNLFDECKEYIERLLLMDVSVDAIVDRHLDDPIFHDMLKKRDSCVTRKDVINVMTRVHSIQS
ncbi:hypothetical protein SUGI_0173400 [Cryptomeria japonica]|nr:hypothetical protein SUGI_0173400 [Cryptomeria japonica]